MATVAQVRLVYRSVPAQIANVVNPVIVVAVLYTSIRYDLLYGRLGLMVLSVLGRLLLMRAYRAAAPRTSEAQVWGRRFAIGAAVAGVLWGALSVVAFLTDAGRRLVRQVILNLISNAIKFSDRGGRVELDAVFGPEGLALTVSDTGIGMGEDEVARLRAVHPARPRPVQAAQGHGARPVAVPPHYGASRRLAASHQRPRAGNQGHRHFPARANRRSASGRLVRSHLDWNRSRPQGGGPKFSGAG